MQLQLKYRAFLTERLPYSSLSYWMINIAIACSLLSELLPLWKDNMPWQYILSFPLYANAVYEFWLHFLSDDDWLWSVFARLVLRDLIKNTLTAYATAMEKKAREWYGIYMYIWPERYGSHLQYCHWFLEFCVCRIIQLILVKRSSHLLLVLEITMAVLIDISGKITPLIKVWIDQ